MKRIFVFFLILIFSFGLVACGNSEIEQRETEIHANDASTEAENGDKAMNNNQENNTGNILVVYFSATGTTKQLAEYASDTLSADIYEIIADDPYTEEDLAYYTDGRADREQNDSSARPAISGGVENMEQYDTILLGYPIWHGQAPRIISTFLESYDFSGKTIIPFCTSHSSGIGSSDTSLYTLAENAKWLDGRRFSAGTSKEEIAAWLDEMGISQSVSPKVGVFDFDEKTVMLNSGYEMPINGLGTYSLHGDECRKSVRTALENGVRLIDTASAYGNEEEIGETIREAIEDGIIKREDIFVITKIYPGEEMKTPEKSIQSCLDKLDIGYVDMMLLHHPDPNDVKAYKAMEQFVEDGKIRSIGLSNWYVEELMEFLPQVDTVPALIQNEIHPYYQENDVIPFIQEKGIVVQGWYPLGGRGHTGELLGDSVISEIADAHGVSSAQVILRWNLQKGVIVIPGSSNPDHIKENTELYHFTLTGDEMDRMNSLDRGEKHDWY
ncbi:MAG: aldo/keto reductase [Eubacterium sp.]|nr:aldo/keto reductase [Eubacterium sp.]